MATLEPATNMRPETDKQLKEFLSRASQSTTVTLDEKEKGSEKVEVCRENQCIVVHEAVTKVFNFMQTRDYFCSLPLDPTQTQIECRKIANIINKQ